MTWARINARRLGWALAALILGALSLEAHAVDYTGTCPSGQTLQWSKDPANAMRAEAKCPGVVPWTDGGPSAVIAACGPDHNTPYSSGVHWAGTYTVDCNVPSGPASCSLRGPTHTEPGHGIYGNNTNLGNFALRCGTPINACTDPAGTPRRITNTGSTTPAATVCLNQCSYTLATGPVISLAGGGSARAAYTSTGQQCGSATPDNTISPNGTPLTDGENTVSGYEDGQQCGTVNGETVCVDAGPPPGQCTVTAGGQSVCTEAPGTPNTAPPAPNNGEHLNTPATPDVTINNGTTITNVYNSTTVNNSNALITNGEGDGEGEGDGQCDPETEECEGEGGDGNEKGRVTGQGGTARTFGASNATIYNAAIESPLGQAVAGIAGSFPTAGTCPPIAFDVPIIGSVATEVHCDIFDGQVRPVLATVMLAVYAVFAVMIILGRN